MSGLGWPRSRRGAHAQNSAPAPTPAPPPTQAPTREQASASTPVPAPDQPAASALASTAALAAAPAAVPAAAPAAVEPPLDSREQVPVPAADGADTAGDIRDGEVLPVKWRDGQQDLVTPVLKGARAHAVELPRPHAAGTEPTGPPADEAGAVDEADEAVAGAEAGAAGEVSEPVARMRSALRDAPAPDLARATDPHLDPDVDLPIGRQAAAAVRALNPGGRHDFPKPARRRVITIANQKGGVGKTTTTVNLAAALALHGANVLVIDLDPQGNCSTGLGVEHRSGTLNVYDVLIDQVPIADVVQPADGVPHLWCVPATIDLAGAEIELVSVVARESRLQRAIATYCEGPGKDLDYVLVDCPPSLGLLTVNAMVATQELLIPIQCEYYALEGLGQLLKNVELVRQHLNTALHVSTILLTMYDARTKLADQVAQEVRTHFGDTVLTTAIPRSVRVSEAPGYGQSVITYDPGSRGALAYLEAAREIAVRGAA